MTFIRLNKLMSHQGICSRRKADEFIKKGWVSVDGKKVVDLGLKVAENAVIELSKEAQQTVDQFTYFKFNKPRGVVSHSPVSGEREIKDFLPDSLIKCRPIGRLDKDSEGLILLTDDGLFAKEMLSSDNPHKRDYLVWVNKLIAVEMLDDLRAGIYMLGKQCKPCQIDHLGGMQYKFTLFEGKNRQIRRMVQNAGSHVVRLKRISFGDYVLGDLDSGLWEEIV